MDNPDQWQQIVPGGDTICFVGTPYAFFVRRANPEKLLIYFQPGGAKMADVEYDGSKPGFDPSVLIPKEEGTARDPHWDNDNPANWNGIFSLDNPLNPFADYSIVFISYCSGDVHWGNAEHEGHYYMGESNVMSALNWAYEHYPNPDKVFVAGSSAGSSGASFYIGRIAANYTDAQIAMLCDSLGGPRTSLPGTIEVWGADRVVFPELGVSAETFNLATPFIVNGQRFPQISIAQFNWTHDFAQTAVAHHFSPDTTLSEQRAANHAEIRAATDNFHVYTAKGEKHVVLRKDDFYTVTVNDVALHEWVSALERGEPLADVEP